MHAAYIFAFCSSLRVLFSHTCCNHSHSCEATPSRLFSFVPMIPDLNSRVPKFTRDSRQGLTGQRVSTSHCGGNYHLQLTSVQLWPICGSSWFDSYVFWPCPGPWGQVGHKQINTTRLAWIKLHIACALDSLPSFPERRCQSYNLEKWQMSKFMLPLCLLPPLSPPPP